MEQVFPMIRENMGIQECVSDAWIGVCTKAGHVAGMWPAPCKKFELRD